MYKQMFQAVRQYRNLKMLKRAGRGQDPGGVDATEEGELAIECPACPHPGRNMPSDLEEIPESTVQVSHSNSNSQDVHWNYDCAECIQI